MYRLSHEGEVQLQYQLSEGVKCIVSDGYWMYVGCDAVGRIYYGDSQGVRCHYGWEQETLVWQQRTQSVLFGWLEGQHAYAATTGNRVHKLSQDGHLVQTYQADAAVFSCAISPEGRLVFAGNNHSTVYCFAEEGPRLWKLATGCGSIYSMQYFEERLYLVTTDGSFACLDVSQAALAQAEQGTATPALSIKAPTSTVAAVESSMLEPAPAGAEGVLLRCVREGGKLRVRVADARYQDWHVQFPKNLRREGQLYLAEHLEPAAHGNFYRVLKNIYAAGT